MLSKLLTKEAATGLEPMLSGAVPAEAVPFLEPSAARQRPYAALHRAGRWMPPMLLAELAELEPLAALEFAGERLPYQTLVTLTHRHPAWALQYLTDRLPMGLLTELVRAHAETLLREVRSIARLPQELLEELARAHPTALLHNRPAAARLPAELLVELARQEPAVALGAVAELLPQEVLEEIARLSPREAVDYPAALTRLPLALRDELIIRAIQSVSDGSRTRWFVELCLERYAGLAPRLVLMHAADWMSPKALETAYQADPELTVRYAFAYLPTVQQVELLQQVPTPTDGRPLPTELLEQLARRRPALAQRYLADHDLSALRADLCEQAPDLVLRHLLSDLTLAELVRLARAAPQLALGQAADRLPWTVLEELARAHPAEALHQIADRLPQELLEELAEREPWAALTYSSGRLSDELLAELAEREPVAAYNAAWYRLSLPQPLLVEVARFAYRLCTEAQTALAEEAPETLLEHGSAHLSTELLSWLAERHTVAALQLAADRLPWPAFKSACLREPTVALGCVSHRLPPELRAHVEWLAGEQEVGGRSWELGGRSWELGGRS